MVQEIKPFLQHVKGNTYCIVTAYMRLPLYRLNETEAILIDSGLPREWKDILQVLQQENLRITSVITSHVHPDHVGNHAALRETFGAKIYSSLFAAAVFASPMNLLSSIAHSGTYQSLKQSSRTYFLPDVIFNWTDSSLTVDGATFEILQIEGHCAEQMGFVTPDGVAYLGDLVLSDQLLDSFSIPYCSCIEPNLEALERIAQTHYDFYILAHNGICQDIRDIAVKNRDNMLQKVEQVARLVDGPVTKDELVVRFIGAAGKNLNSPRRVHGIHYNISALLAYLIDAGRLQERVKDGIVQYIPVGYSDPQE